jgi:hypothetical protein
MSIKQGSQGPTSLPIPHSSPLHFFFVDDFEFSSGFFYWGPRTLDFFFSLTFSMFFLAVDGKKRKRGDDTLVQPSFVARGFLASNDRKATKGRNMVSMLKGRWERKRARNTAKNIPSQAGV